MGVNDLLNNAGLDLSGFGALNFAAVFQGFMILLIFGTIFAVLIFMYIRSKQYNKTIEIYTEINGQTAPIGIDKAKEIIIPGTSLRAFLLKKRKLYLTRPSIQTGKNTYMFFIRKDGEWINIGLSNLNTDMTELGLLFDHTDMRMANQTLKDLIDVNYGGQTFFQKYAPYIGVAILCLLLFIGGYMFMRESNKAAGGLASSADKILQVAEKLDQIIAKADSINSQSGIRGALTLGLMRSAIT